MIKTLRNNARHAVCLAAFFLSLTASAEQGDYTAAQVKNNYSRHPIADRPVTEAEQASTSYPLALKSSLNSLQLMEEAYGKPLYDNWLPVTMPPETGASCGNGSPYRMFVRLVPHTSNTVFFFEGGGACWTGGGCTNDGKYDASNPKGIPRNYMQTLTRRAVSTVEKRWEPRADSRVKLQDWNFVFLPYCTGDLHAGDKLAQYTTENGKPLIWYHRGLRNVRAAVSWVRNNMPRPAQLVVTGFSAGGAAATLNYAHIREDISPDRGFLINDSGPLPSVFDINSGSRFPSAPLIKTISKAWAFHDTGNPNVGILSYTANRIGTNGIDFTNPSSIYTVLANKYPNDRMGYIQFQRDRVYSAYSYSTFHKQLQGKNPEMPGYSIGSDQDINNYWRDVLSLWGRDTNSLRLIFSNISNFGSYFPYYRDVAESHCASVVNFNRSDIQELGLELKDFYRNILDGDGAVIDAFEESGLEDLERPLSSWFSIINRQGGYEKQKNAYR